VNYFLQNVVNALSLGSLYALFALGVALIFGIMRLINFAHGELIMVAGYGIVFSTFLPWPAMTAIVITTVVVFALAMERVAFRPVRGASPSTLLVTSFALSFFLQYLALMIFGGLPKVVNIFPSLNGYYTVGGIDIRKLDLVTVGVTLGVLVALGVFLTRTRLGVQMRAAAEDFGMARLLGVRANTVIATAFAMSGFLAGVAALLFVATTGTVNPVMGSSVVLVAFIATVMGGLGSLVGATLGGFGLGGVTVALQAYLPLELRSYRDAFAYGAVIIVLLVRPQGLIVARSVETRV
jgi:branched-chain amino acid transport system permease protein